MPARSPAVVLPYVVPGAYLIRAGSLTIEQMTAELTPVGMLYIRRFLPYNPQSDFLTLFDPKVLAAHSRRIEKSVPTAHLPSRETAVGSWAAKVNTPASSAPPAVIVVAATSPFDGRQEPTTGCEDVIQASTGKKMRPGRHARQMLKTLKEACEPPPPPVKEEKKQRAQPPPAEAVPPRPTAAEVTATPDPAASLSVSRGSLVFEMRPFRVSDVFDGEADCLLPHLES